MNNRFANFGFIAAALVVLLHVAIAHDAIRRLCGIAVPFFFFASGWFLAAKCNEMGWWRKALARRVHTLLVPFLCFNVLSWLMSKGWGRGLSATTLLTPFGLTLHITEYNLLWYVRALMMLVVLSPVLCWIVRRKWLGVAWLAGVFVLQLLLKGEVWGFVFSIAGLFYFSAGMFCRLQGLKHEMLEPADIALGAIGVFCFVVTCAFPGAGAYGGALYPIVLLGVWRLVPDVPWPRALTSTAFAVYLLHPMIIKVFRITGYGGWFDGSAGGAIVMWLVVTAMSVAIARLMSHWMRPVADIVFGGRVKG